MMFVRHSLQLARNVLRYGIAEHRLSFVLVLLLGALAVILALVSQAVVPFVFYPFA